MGDAGADADPRAGAWRRFRASWSVRLGLGLLAGMVLIGVYAPFLASETALLWRDERGWSLPILADLFNQRRYPKIYDYLFNLMAFTLPATLAIGWWRGWGWDRRIALSLLAPVAIGVVALLPLVPRAGGIGDDGQVQTRWTGLWAKSPLEQRTLRTWHADPTRARTAVFTPLGHDWRTAYAGLTFAPPGTANPATGRQLWLGSDGSGRDVAAMLAHGARISLTIGLFATALSMLIGILIGAASGYLGGRVDLLLQRLVEVMMCFPVLILIIVVVAALGRDIFVIMTVIGLTGWADTARLVRGEVLAQSARDYVLAGQSLGLGRWRIMLRHILPNCMTPILITAVFGVAGGVLGEAGLSFIGLGDASTPSWGVLLNQGRESLHYAWLVWTPGLAVFLLITALYQVGNGLRGVYDPKGTA